MELNFSRAEISFELLDEQEIDEEELDEFISNLKNGEPGELYSSSGDWNGKCFIKTEGKSSCIYLMAGGVAEIEIHVDNNVLLPQLEDYKTLLLNEKHELQVRFTSLCEEYHVKNVNCNPQDISSENIRYLIDSLRAFFSEVKFRGGNIKPTYLSVAFDGNHIVLSADFGILKVLDRRPGYIYNGKSYYDDESAWRNISKIYYHVK